MIDDPAVSRIHAWIDLEDDRWYIADAGSRAGTIVNGEALAMDRYRLKHNDQVRIGPATLRFVNEEQLPSGTTEVDLTPRTNEEMSRSRGGVFMDCVCGAPLWFPENFTGAGRCVHCGEKVKPVLPTAPPTPWFINEPPPRPQPNLAPQPPAEQTLAEQALAEQNLAEPSPVEQGPAEQGPASETLAEQTLDDENFDLFVDDALARLDPLAMADRDVASPAEAEAPAPAPVAAPPEQTARDSGSQPAPAPLPQPPLAAPTPAAPPRAEKERFCGVCHSTVTRFDETATCPACGLLFHADCWQENRGCSAYGCSQVNALEPREHHV